MMSRRNRSNRNQKWQWVFLSRANHCAVLNSVVIIINFYLIDPVAVGCRIGSLLLEVIILAVEMRASVSCLLYIMSAAYVPAYNDINKVLDLVYST